MRMKAQVEIPIQPKAVDHCPACAGTENRVYATVVYSPTYKVRYHICSACGQRFKTEEAQR